MSTSKTHRLLGWFIFFAVFVAASKMYIQYDNTCNITLFKRHAAIITNDLWALDKSGITSYLQLAVSTGHYKYLSVTLEKNTPFVRVEAPPLSGLDTLLSKARLLPLQKFSVPISYKDRSIGALDGEHYNRQIYPLANIFGLLVLLRLAILYVIDIRGNRRILKEQVIERTRKYRDSEQRFQDLINLLPEIVCETDVRGNLTYVNKIALKRFGLTSDQIRSTSCIDLIVEDQQERARKNFAVFLQGRELELQEFTARGANGTTFPVLTRSAPIYNGPHVIGVRSIIIDMSERFTLEKKLRSAQRMEVIGLMASGVAHDLNNILSGIVNYPELVLQKLLPDSDLRPLLTAIKNSGLRAAEVVNDLLTVARGAAASRVIANPNTLVREYLDSPEFKQLRQRFPDIRWQYDLDEQIANISCSPVHVKKCLMNLISNGFEAISGSGELLLTTRQQQENDPAEQDETLSRRSWAVISVADSGPGIAEKDLRQIFEPFYTRKVMGRSGTGLGLTVVANTMRDHEGEIRVKSSEQGTAFRLYFPVTDKKITSLDLPETRQAMLGNNEKILVIDDDPQQRDIAMQLLLSLNYRVSTAASGEEAVEYLRTRAVHLLLLDMLMPPGMSGLQTYQQILVIHPRQKAVLVSGFSESREVVEALKLGAADFIKKPYVLEQLSQVVYTALH